MEYILYLMLTYVLSQTASIFILFYFLKSNNSLRHEILYVKKGVYIQLVMFMNKKFMRWCYSNPKVSLYI